MSSFPILDLVIGLIFIFFLLSIICSSAVELWLSLQKARAKMLEQWLKTIFNLQSFDSHGIPVIGSNRKPHSLGQAIMDHCMVTGLSKTGNSTTYIDSENFVSALLDKISITPKAATTSGTPALAVELTSDAVQVPPADLDSYIAAIKESKVISGELKRTFLILASEAKNTGETIEKIAKEKNVTTNIIQPLKSDLDLFKEKLERWYDTNNERLTGKFKQVKVLPRTVIVAIVITFGFNVDTAEIASYLYNHRDVSKQFADQALANISSLGDTAVMINDPATQTNNISQADAAVIQNNIKKVRQEVGKFRESLPAGLPLGWSNDTIPWHKHIPGWIATIFAITMGAPFWFDILNKIANLRGNGVKPATAEEKKANK